ncbi:MAG: hypothetical protein O3A95_04195 [Planctomycetota bacterium]|nr:hypothetical protein [Planctomycetota bacterium]MDA1113484.1 hypothetical protein [Planctomycetota bacterium]
MAKALNKAQEKAHKKKVVILSVMVLATAGTWSKTLFGKDHKAAEPGVAVASTGAAGALTATPATPGVGATSSITSYDQAVRRMDLWPQALNRQVHLGTIEELTPINDLLSADDNSGFGNESGIMEETPAYLSSEIPPVVEDEPILFSALRLRLTTTARFGKNHYAVINGNRVKLGESVEVQVDGQTVQYEVRAIETRMVEVAFQGTSHILLIDLPELQHRNKDGA